MTNRVGQRLGNYRLIRLLGQGGFAEVYLGEHIHLETQAALKVLHTVLSDEYKRAFLTEARRLVRLDHPHIVRLLDFGIEEGIPFLVMEYAPNGTLRTRHPRGSHVQFELAVTYVKQVADALEYLHNQKLVHRDVKPANMLLGANQTILLSDLGIAAVAHATATIIEQGQAGTPPYMAPEQILQMPRPASDQYSLGIVVYEWLCGVRPFDGSLASIIHQQLHTPPPPFPQWLSGVFPSVEEVVRKALAKDPKQRFTSVQAFATALEQSSRMANQSFAISSESQPPSSLRVHSSEPLSIPPNLESSEVVSITNNQHEPLLSSSPAGTTNILSSMLSQYQDTSNSTDQLAQFNAASQPSQWSNAPSPLVWPTGTLSPRLPQTPLHQTEVRPLYRRHWFSLAVILLSLLIIAGSVAVIFIPRGLVGNNPGAASQSVQTGQTTYGTGNLPIAPSNLTATAHAQTTVSAIAALTATAAAQASATAGVIQTATSGSPVYQDSLKNVNNPQTVAAGWDQSNNCGFQSDGYHDTTTGSLQGCKEANNNYANAAITVVMRILSGQSGGVFFRVVSSPSNNFGAYAGYLFEVDGNGRFRVLSSDNYNNAPVTLQDWTTSNALSKGSQANTLQLIMRGNTLALYANGVFLAHLSASNYSNGLVAFLARSDGSTPADVVYTDLNIYPLS